MNQSSADALSLHAPTAEPRTPWESIDPDEPKVPAASPLAAQVRPRALRSQRPPIVIAQHLFEETPAVFTAESNVDLAQAFVPEDEDDLIERAFFSDVATFDASTLQAPAVVGQSSACEPTREASVTAPVAIRVDPIGSQVPQTNQAPDAFASPTALVVSQSVGPSANEPAAPEATPWDLIDEGADQITQIVEDAPLAAVELAQQSREDQTAAPVQSKSITATAPHRPADTVAPAIFDVKSDISNPSAATQSPSIPQADPVPIIASPLKLAARRLLRSGKSLLAPQPAPQQEYELAPDPDLASPSITLGGGWTIPIMCLGFGLIACCVIIPQAEANRFLVHEHQSLAANLGSIEKQVSVNNGFLKSVADDPALAERLASRQMKTIRKGQKVLKIEQMPDDTDMSPFALVDVSLPPQIPAYKPIHSTIANLCNNAHSRLYMMGASLLFVAVGLVLGSSKVPGASPAPEAE